MSNASRAALTVVSFALTLIAFFGAQALALSLGLPPLQQLGLVLAAFVAFLFAVGRIASFAKCWRCRRSLFRSADEGLYSSPIPFVGPCPDCGIGWFVKYDAALEHDRSAPGPSIGLPEKILTVFVKLLSITLKMGFGVVLLIPVALVVTPSVVDGTLFTMSAPLLMSFALLSFFGTALIAAGADALWTLVRGRSA